MRKDSLKTDLPPRFLPILRTSSRRSSGSSWELFKKEKRTASMRLASALCLVIIANAQRRWAKSGAEERSHHTYRLAKGAQPKR